jgi:predicted DNA-binding transcriptional regulator YafY
MAATTMADRTAILMSALLKGKTLDRHTAAELAGVKPAAAYELLRTLQTHMGDPIVEDLRDGRTAFRFDGELVAPPKFLAVVAACIGASLSRVVGGARLQYHMREGLEYLLERVRRKDGFTDLDRKFVFLARGGGESALPEREGELDDVLEAVLHSEHLRIDYTHASGSRAKVVILPYSLAIYDHQLYVLARDDRYPVYPYRFSRMAAVERLGTHFSYPAKGEYDPMRHFADSFGIFVTETYPRADVVIRLRGYWAKYAPSHCWHPSQQLEAREDGSFVLRMKVRTCPELENWILSLGQEAEVIGPRALRDKIASRVNGMAALYTGAAPGAAAPTRLR